MKRQSVELDSCDTSYRTLYYVLINLDLMSNLLEYLHPITDIYSLCRTCKQFAAHATQLLNNSIRLIESKCQVLVYDQLSQKGIYNLVQQFIHNYDAAFFHGLINQSIIEVLNEHGAVKDKFSPDRIDTQLSRYGILIKCENISDLDYTNKFINDCKEYAAKQIDMQFNLAKNYLDFFINNYPYASKLKFVYEKYTSENFAKKGQIFAYCLGNFVSKGSVVNILLHNYAQIEDYMYKFQNLSLYNYIDRKGCHILYPGEIAFSRGAISYDVLCDISYDEILRPEYIYMAPEILRTKGDASKKDYILQQQKFWSMNQK